MGRKRTLVIVLALAAVLLLAGATTAFAGGALRGALSDEEKAQLAGEAQERLEQDLADGRISQEQYDKMLEAFENGGLPFFGKLGRGGPIGMMGAGMADMMKEMKEMKEMMAGMMEEMRAKWDALTEEEKAEIYGLYEQKAAIDRQIIGKYFGFGLIGPETAEEMKAALEAQKDGMRANSMIPMMPMKGMRWR